MRSLAYVWCLFLAWLPLEFSTAFMSLRAHRVIHSIGFQAQGQGDDEPHADEASAMQRELANRAESLAIEEARAQLEEANRRAFLKSRPRKLPYAQASRWVRDNLGVDSREDFEDLVENGNLRTPYIPKRPEEYYRSTGEWNSWQHFLTGMRDDEAGTAGASPGIFE